MRPINEICKPIYSFSGFYRNFIHVNELSTVKRRICHRGLYGKFRTLSGLNEVAYSHISLYGKARMRNEIFPLAYYAGEFEFDSIEPEFDRDKKFNEIFGDE